MTKYLVSDLHLDHENIIQYCNRPFESVEEMNATLVENWNETVDPGDKVLFLGDLAMASGDEAIQWAEQLNGRLMFIDGNHDDINDSEAPFPVYEAYVIRHGKYRFYCTHRPENVPDGWTHWVLYGHHHNNDLTQYPFADTNNNRVNASVEVINYRPISLDTVTSVLDSGGQYSTLSEYRETQ